MCSAASCQIQCNIVKWAYLAQILPELRILRVCTRELSHRVPQMWSWRLISLADMVCSLSLFTVTLQASGSGSSWKSESSLSLSRDSTDEDDRSSELRMCNSNSYSNLKKQYKHKFQASPALRVRLFGILGVFKT